MRAIELIYPADANRLSLDIMQESQEVFQCNLGSSEDMEYYLNREEEMPPDISIIDEEEFFTRYFDNV